MEYLFNTENSSGNSELKEMLSFIDADLKLKSLLPDIKTATKDVIKLIGKGVYAKAVEAYNQETISAEDKEFINAVRYPIAIQAYRLYAPTGDVAHTNNGRKMRQDDGDKLPFEWLLDRDNKSMEIRYYRALDELIDYLDSTEIDEIETLWRASEAFTISRDLFVCSTAEFNSIFPIESRLLYLKLAPGLKDCEDYSIKSLIGNIKMKALKAAINSGDEITDETDIELIRLIKTATAFHAMAWSIPRNLVNLYPEGVLQHYTSDKITTKAARPTLKSEPTETRMAFEADSEKALKAIQKLLEPAPISDPESTLLPDQLFGDKYFSA